MSKRSEPLLSVPLPVGALRSAHHDTSAMCNISQCSVSHLKSDILCTVHAASSKESGILLSLRLEWFDKSAKSVEVLPLPPTAAAVGPLVSLCLLPTGSLVGFRLLGLTSSGRLAVLSAAFSGEVSLVQHSLSGTVDVTGMTPVLLSVAPKPCTTDQGKLYGCPFSVVWRRAVEVAVHEQAAVGGASEKKPFAFRSPTGNDGGAKKMVSVLQHYLYAGIASFDLAGDASLNLGSATPMKHLQQPPTISDLSCRVCLSAPTCLSRGRVSTAFAWEAVVCLRTTGAAEAPMYTLVEGSIGKRGDVGRCQMQAEFNEQSDTANSVGLLLNATEKMPYSVALEHESYMADSNAPYLYAPGHPKSTASSFFHSGGRPILLPASPGAKRGCLRETPSVDDWIAGAAPTEVQFLELAGLTHPLLLYTLPQAALLVDTKYGSGRSVIAVIKPPASVGTTGTIISAFAASTLDSNPTIEASILVVTSDTLPLRCEFHLSFEVDRVEECLKITGVQCRKVSRYCWGGPQPPTNNLPKLLGLARIPSRAPASDVVCQMIPPSIPGIPRLDSSGGFTLWAVVTSPTGVLLVDYFSVMTASETSIEHSIHLTHTLPSEPSSVTVVWDVDKLVCAVGYPDGRVSFWERQFATGQPLSSSPTLKYDRCLHDGVVSHLVYVGDTSYRTADDFRFISVSTCGSVCLHRTADYIRYGMLGNGGGQIDGLFLDPEAGLCMVSAPGGSTIYHALSGRVERTLMPAELSAHRHANLLSTRPLSEDCLYIQGHNACINPIAAIEQHAMGKHSAPVMVALGYAMAPLRQEVVKTHLGAAFSFVQDGGPKSNCTTFTQQGLTSMAIAIAAFSAVSRLASIPRDLMPTAWLSSTLTPHAGDLNEFLTCNKAQVVLVSTAVDALRTTMATSDGLLTASAYIIEKLLEGISHGTLCAGCKAASQSHSALPLELFASALVPGKENEDFFKLNFGVDRAQELMVLMRVVIACLAPHRTHREVEVAKQYTHQVESEIKRLCDAEVGLQIVALKWESVFPRCRDASGLMEQVLLSGWEGGTSQTSKRALIRMFLTMLRSPEGYDCLWTTIDKWYKSKSLLRGPILRVLLNLVQLHPEAMISSDSIAQTLSFVWRALDPHNPNKSERDQVLPIATQFFRVAVGSCPTLCFHQKSQRVVLGKPDGQVTLYDAKSTDEITSFVAFPSPPASRQPCTLQSHSVIAVAYLTSNHDIAVLPANLSCVKIFSAASSGSFFAFVASSHHHYKLKTTISLDTPGSSIVTPEVAVKCSVTWLSPVCVEVISPYHDRLQLEVPPC